MAAGRLGALAITVDLNLGGAGGKHGPKQETAILTRLLELFDLYELSATWAAAEPAQSDAIGRIRETGAAHEIALLGESTWVGSEAGRPQFARQLERRMGAACGAGLSLSTLALCGARVPRDHYDLLVKHSVCVVRQSRAGARRALAALQPQSLRHGVWEAPPSATLPQRGAWFGTGAGAGRGAVRKAIAMSGFAQIILDVAGLAERDPRLQAVESVLRYAARAVGRGQLRMESLSRLAAEWMQPLPTTPARSILRAA